MPTSIFLSISGLCRNAEDDWTCQPIFFWHLVGIVKSAKNKTDTLNWPSSIFLQVLIGNYNSFISTAMLRLLVNIYCEVYNLHRVLLGILPLRFSWSYYTCDRLILRWNPMHRGQQRDQQQQRQFVFLTYWYLYEQSKHKHRHCMVQWRCFCLLDL